MIANVEKILLANAITDTGAIAIRWRNAPGWPIEEVSANAIDWGIDAQALQRGACFAELMHPEDLARIESDILALPADPERWHMEYRIRCGHRWRWVEDRSWVERGSDGDAEAFHCVLFDISDRKSVDAGLSLAAQSAPLLLGNGPLKARIAQLLRRVGECFQAQRAFLFEFEGTDPGNYSIRHSIWQKNGLSALRDGVRMPISAAQARWIRVLQKDQCIRGTLNDFPPIERNALKALGIGSLMVVPIRCRAGLFGFLGIDDGHSRMWAAANEASMRIIAAALGAAIERDAADLHSETQLRNALDAAETRQQVSNHVAEIDALTGLPNRVAAQRMIDESAQSPGGGRFFVGLLDIDRFRIVNDGLGYDYGDFLLRSVAGRLRSILSGEDFIARTGCDEFMIIARSAADAKGASLLAERLLEALREPVCFADGQVAFVEASIGFSVFPDDGASSMQLLRGADAALYRAKSTGGNEHQFYTPELVASAQRKLTLDAQLRRALLADEFVVHYQPIFDCEDERLTGVEALVRWRMADGRLVMPGEFIAAAEDGGLIGRLGDRVLESACRQVQRWRQTGHEALRLSVNLSARQLLNPEFQSRLMRILAESGLDPAALELELTESLLMEHGRDIERTLSALRLLGIRIAIDDFGTGYSSLAYLRRLPVDTIKIDRCFVADVGDTKGGDIIAGAIVALGQQLNLTVLAEGVESEAQLRFFRARGCRLFQGHLKSPALTADEFAKRYSPPAIDDAAFLRSRLLASLRRPAVQSQMRPRFGL